MAVRTEHGSVAVVDGFVSGRLYLAGKRIVVTGGTGSLGQTLVRRLLGGELGVPESVTVFSRDEAKQHEMRLAFADLPAATDEVIYRSDRLRFRIGDVADFHSVAAVLRNADVVFNCAALKQVPTCEYAPLDAVRTNVGGPGAIVRAIRDLALPVETVCFISTDKACKPVNVMGMTKAIQERVFIEANLECDTRFVGVRYGNVLSSRGSVVPLFHHQIKHGGPVTITTPEMTRFLLSLDEAVDTVLAALTTGRAGEIYIPRIPSARIVDVAKALIGDRGTAITFTGIRPGEKTHEILVSDEEVDHTSSRGSDYYAIHPVLPQFGDHASYNGLIREFSSCHNTLAASEVKKLLTKNGLLLDCP
jgi:UDP-glucose 4-epimerase